MVIIWLCKGSYNDVLDILGFIKSGYDDEGIGQEAKNFMRSEDRIMVNNRKLVEYILRCKENMFLCAKFQGLIYQYKNAWES